VTKTRGFSKAVTIIYAKKMGCVFGVESREAGDQNSRGASQPERCYKAYKVKVFVPPPLWM